VAAGLLAIISGFVVARLAGPAEYGIGIAPAIVHVMLWVLATAIFADPVVQRAEVTQAALAGALHTAIGIGFGAAAIQLAASIALAHSLDDARLPAMGLALALPLPLVGASGVALGILTRARAYRLIAARTVIGQGLGTACGVAAACLGLGAWAVVLQQMVSSLAGAAVLLLAAPPPWRRPDWAAARAMLRIGVPLVSSTLIQAARYRMFSLMAGGIAGGVVLGQVHMAFRMVDTVRELANNALWRLLLPRFAREQNDDAALLAVVDRALASYGVLVFPAFGALFAIIGPLVALLLGPQWLGAADAAPPLILLACLNMLTFAAGAAVIARGYPAGFLGYNAVALASTLLCCWIAAPHSAASASLAWLCGQLIALPVAFVITARVLHAGWLRQIRAGLAPLALGLAASAAAFAMPSVAGGGGSDLHLLVWRLFGWGLVALPGGALMLWHEHGGSRWEVRRA
jgi:PST family polysaccharide transporter